MQHTPTPHNAAKQGQIAPFVLLPGDPLRAQYVAEHLLQNARQVTGIRGMLGFTGLYNGKSVSIMGSGMGGPSAGIYSYELFAFYGVEHIVRIGTAGGYHSSLHLGDLVFAMTACTDSNYAYQYQLPGTFCPSADFTLLKKAASFAEEHGYSYQAGSLFSSDMYSEYNALGGEKAWKPWANMGCIAQDMETYALYCNAAYLKKSALSIVMNVADCISGKCLDTKDFTALEPMMKTALSLA
ncbi:MAG: purine-nucleoside phosphorylase [Treponema sp.]|nr:purine-nucleoside phosphorylase [Treponema sp.]